MKKLIPMLLGFLMVCSACGKQTFDPGLVREQYNQQGLQGEYTVSTHGGFYTEYRLSSVTEGDCTAVTILEPASVAGVKALLRQGETTIQYQDVSIDALLPQVPGYAPMDALHGIEECLREEQPAVYCLENEVITLDYTQTLPDGTEALRRVVLREDTLELLSAELYLAGDLMLVLQMERPDVDG